MDLEVTKKSSNHVEFILRGQRHTLPNLLKKQLLKDPQVSFAAYRLDHPLGDDARFVLKTKDKSAKKALADAVKAMEKDLSDFEKEAKRALK